MKELKRKHLDRREWYSDTDREFACVYRRDNCFAGAVGLLTFTGLPKPEYVHSVRGEMCIADKGYQWLELVPENDAFDVQVIDLTERRLAIQGIAIGVYKNFDVK